MNECDRLNKRHELAYVGTYYGYAEWICLACHSIVEQAEDAPFGR